VGRDRGEEARHRVVGAKRSRAVLGAWALVAALVVLAVGFVVLVRAQNARDAQRKADAIRREADALKREADALAREADVLGREADALKRENERLESESGAK
jgi:uncharacterized protein HemX